ncbi:MAG: UDP-N-acetylglucosamine 1-carboxyvinyltransferase [Candidatus Harrisonbacteria bacterium RIFCSPLOWO2_01_FULL_40_28]|uniref:UDP-N-acetylglucosamine 1-carboxyvinyltransferase n=1 Tax=Candidatus Harrisonbacteria bacterium RIFCSPLOWO2_01_FULL_40_28 TaxID=1798406 RepID=A0A1G1ZPL9_9BACT|nr:MAG: UDP-N-acetylglucosamine 1-carboxyvinyltransferase [Candidatus Harrisonbacteria bacterium RIFCSPLOWO2_01_FULL_40_28]
MKFIVQGGNALHGEIRLSGAKNAATKMLVASLLTDEECVFDNFPDIGDTHITIEFCKTIGSEIRLEGSRLITKTPTIKTSRVPSLPRRNRIPILALGPLLARTHEAYVPVLGGDKIGPRPVDLHLQALRALGAEVIEKDGGYCAEARGGLRGGRIHFSYPSVGATENAILAAVLACGKTTIVNAAVEPEVIEIIKMLQKMGAIIEIGTNRTIYIEGVKKLRGVMHRVISDRNEAVSFASLALATGSKIKVIGALQDHLITFLNNVRRVGGEYEIVPDGIVFWGKGPLCGMEIETDTHPGFMTDWQQPFVVVLTQAKGVSIIHETVFEDRFGYVDDLNAMGANIKIFSKCLGESPCRFNGMGFRHSAVIYGPTKLTGVPLAVRDLRSGITHLIAALTADNQSVIDGIEEIDRGYENIDERLRILGADIKRV